MQKKYLRDAVGEGMLELGRRNDRVVAVSADVMGSCRVRGFAEKFPNRAFNTGIAEQEMVSFSAGLAREGFIAYAFTFGPFMNMRACEQIRTDVTYNRLNVKFISIYSGVSGGISGATHWALEDCAIMRGIPEMTILEPCDCRQLYRMLEVSTGYKGPVYIRITIEPVTEIYGEEMEYQVGKANRVMEGKDGVFICSGITVKYAIGAAKRIEEEAGKNIRVVDMHTIKPIDEDEVIEAAETGHIIVAQDHNVVGGLGGAVAMVIAEKNLNTKFKVIGIPDQFFTVGHAPYLYHKFRYDEKGLYDSMMRMLELRGGNDQLAYDYRTAFYSLKLLEIYIRILSDGRVCHG